MSVSGAITHLNAKALEISGVRAAPDRAPEEMNIWPFAFTWTPKVDVMRHSGALKRDLWTFRTEFHMPAQDMGRALETLTTIMQQFAEKVVGDVTLGGNVDTGANPVGQIGPSQYAGVQTFAAVFDVTAKVIGT